MTWSGWDSTATSNGSNRANWHTTCKSVQLATIVATLPAVNRHQLETIPPTPLIGPLVSPTSNHDQEPCVPTAPGASQLLKQCVSVLHGPCTWSQDRIP